MPGSSGERGFDIYATSAGYAAVTNPVRRRILASLANGDLDLPALVKITGKSKPTLSNLHIRELLAQGLVMERAHETDARRKLYRLVSQRIGSSDLPVEELRGAVKQYVTKSPLALSLPITKVIWLVASAEVPDAALQSMGRELGRQTASAFEGATPHAIVTSVTEMWDREQIATLQGARRGLLGLKLSPHGPLDPASRKRLACTLAGMLEGVLATRTGKTVHAQASSTRESEMRIDIEWA
ncbi:MAG: ArsR/SmtB family transcription factor [Thermoplasmatota archaeon]